MSDDPIRAIGNRTDNAQLMLDCAALGYLPEPVLDATYGFGRFWTKYRPTLLTTNDLETPADHAFDFRDMPFRIGEFETVVFDPPYKLNGTSTGLGPSTLDVSYGVGGAYMNVAAKHEMMRQGLVRCARVSNQFVLAKCQDQICNGSLHMQSTMLQLAANRVGLPLVDVLHVSGYRKQPEGRRQVHAHRDYSTLLVFKWRNKSK